MILDLIFLVPALWFLIKGIQNGLISEIASLAGLLLGLYVAVYFSDKVGGKLGISGSQAGIISFGITFLIVLVVALLLGKLAEKLVGAVSLAWLNKIMGGLFGVMKVLLIASVLLFLIGSIDKKQRLLTDKQRSESYIYPFVSPIAPTLYSRLVK